MRSGTHSWTEAARSLSEAEWDAFRSALPEGAISSDGPPDAAVIAVVMPVEGTLFADDAREALSKGFEALGADWADVRTVPAVRAETEPQMGWPRLLAWEIEIVDPALVLVFGAEAAGVARSAWPGESAGALGRPVRFLPDIEESLATQEGKRALWEELKDLGVQHL